MMQPIPLDTKQIGQFIVTHPITLFVAILSCVPFLISHSFGFEKISVWFMPKEFSALIGIDTLWRLWSPTFVHYTLMHLVTNLFLWAIFASYIEKHSPRALLLLICIAGALANLAEWFVSGPNFGGLSGLALGAMGFTWVATKTQVIPTPSNTAIINNNTYIAMLIFIPVCATGLFGHYANAAHIAGLCSGALLAWVISVIIDTDKLAIN